MDEFVMVFEDIYDAIRHTVQRCGGAKSVGSALFPDKTPGAAGRYLSDCLNEHRPEKLNPQQMIALMVIGHSRGCHSIMTFVAESVGYHPPTPVSTEEQRAALQERYVDAVENVRRLFQDINNMDAA